MSTPELWPSTNGTETIDLQQEGVHLTGAAGGEEALGQACMFGYYPSLGKLEVRVDLASVTHPAAWDQYDWADITVRGLAGATPLAQEKCKLAGGVGEAVLNLPRLADGSYELLVVLGRDSLSTKKRFKQKNYPWLGNKLGLSRQVYPPFLPIRVAGKEAHVVLRVYRMNGFGLWDSVVSEGHELLAAPLALHVLTEKGEESWRFKEGRWVSVEADRVVYEAEAEARVVRVRTVSSIEYDGCMKVEMELLPGRQREKIQRLWLEMPIVDREAALFHYVTIPDIRRNYAGATPRGGKITWGPRPKGPFAPEWKAEPGSEDGVLWTCQDTRPWKQLFKADFVPYIWLGGGERGIAWFGENPRGYVLDSAGTVQKLERRGERLYLRVDFINKPWVLEEGRRVVFGLQASPTRPMPKDWRANLAVTALPAGGDMCCWGGYIWADKYPDNHDFHVVDEILKVRRTKALDRTIFEQLDRQRPDAWKRVYRSTWLDYVLGAAMINQSMPREWKEASSGVILGAVMAPLRYHVDTQYNDAGRPEGAQRTNPIWETASRENLYPERVASKIVGAPLAIYMEGHGTDITTEEWEVYQDEWRAERFVPKRTEIIGQMQPRAMSIGQAITSSYRDFMLYYANEWMKRGVSIYMDNVFFMDVHNPMTSTAYLDEKGDLQPAATIWDQREYYKRIWTLAQEWNRKETPYPITITHHITNTLILPFHTWNNATLDLEWTWWRDWTWANNASPEGPVPFPAELVLTESSGRQVGSYPHILESLTSIRGNTWFKGPNPQLVRMEWGMRLVHEAMRWLFPFENRAVFEPARAMEKKLWEFGYGTDDCAVTNYWADDPAIVVSDPQTKWLLLARKRDAKLFLALQSYRKEDARVDVQVDTERLGFSPSATAFDVETGAEVRVENTDKVHLKVLLEGPYGTRALIMGKT
jgi:hypothetical protein